jgi:hypothetical protein
MVEGEIASAAGVGSILRRPAVINPQSSWSDRIPLGRLNHRVGDEHTIARGEIDEPALSMGSNNDSAEPP